MADQSIGDLENLYEQIENLKRQNEILEMESEITGFEKELDDYADQLQMSTPKPGKAEPLLGTKQLKLGIPAGRADDTQKSGTEAEELNTPRQP